MEDALRRVAVDAITDELQRTVEFINSHTVPAVELLALALRYVKDKDVEVLAPTIYGVEAVREKARHATRQWAESDLFAALAQYVEPSVGAALRRVYESAKQHPTVVTPVQQLAAGHFYWGTGKYPSVGAWYVVEGRAVAVWSIYTDPTKTVFAINFEWRCQQRVKTDPAPTPQN